MRKRILLIFAIVLGITGCGHASDESEQSNIVENTEIETEIVDLHAYDFTLCFAGDISLDEAAVTTAQLDASENGIYDCII